MSDLLVIAPAGAYRTWETAIADDLADELRARTSIYTWISDAPADTTEFLDPSGPRILLMNVEALSTVERARALCQIFWRNVRPWWSSTNRVCIKNHKAKRTKFRQQASGGAWPTGAAS